MLGFHSKLWLTLAGFGAASALALGFTDLADWSIVGWLVGALSLCVAAIYQDKVWGVVATALTAAGCNGYLLSNKLAAAAGPSACTINSYIDCDKVNASVYSEAFGLPITLFGVAFYLGLALAGMLSRGDNLKELSFQRTNGLFALLNLAYSAFLAWASVQLGALCVVCITIYVCNGLLLWAAARALGSFGAITEHSATALAKQLPVIAVTFVVVTAFGASAWSGQSGTPTVIAEGDDDAWAQIYRVPAGEISWDGTEPLLGNEDGAYLIVEYADFGCPHCAHAEEQLQELVAAYDDVAVRFKYFPLDGNCNPALQANPNNTSRCDATFAAECAHQQGKFWEMAHLLFQNQGFFEAEQLAKMAGQVGLDMDTWQACLEDPATRTTIERNAKAGDVAGLQGTPALFVQGTHGDRFVEVTAAVPGVVTLLDAHREGKRLPAPQEVSR